ncbi:helix-turn-helix domain-containing protein [Actinoplanes subtropicus]|uniref:helix-turn-helix domain-containing protein n=1 Tax=Actinoplanes subtropicus TaxID=543632 RepID=UPI0004C37026|nr:helix-turn-helix domain-containing protein [Actinoplanes subtropicus]
MILVVDDTIGRHLAAALRAHIRQLRQEGMPIPAALAELASVAANRRQSPPTFDVAADSGDSAPVDALTLDFHAAGCRLGVSARSVSRLVADGKLPAVKVAGFRRIRAKDIESYVDGLAPVDRKADA